MRRNKEAQLLLSNYLKYPKFILLAMYDRTAILNKRDIVSLVKPKSILRNGLWVA